MSYIFLQEQAGESLAECFSDIPAYVLSRLNLIADRSCSKGSATESCQGSQSGTMLKPLTGSRGEGLSMSSAAGSPAKTSVTPEQEPESKEVNLDFGQKWQGSFTRLDPLLRLWKTPQALLFAGLETFSETWPKFGIMQDGACWALTPSELTITENEFGYWLPTPTKSDAELGAPEGKDDTFRITSTGMPRKINRNGTSGSVGLARLLAMMPTPRKSRGFTNPTEGKERNDCLTTFLLGKPVLGMRPNPEFVEWMMDWPIGWTERNPLATDKFQQWFDSHGKL
jgi:hypothetical protein